MKFVPYPIGKRCSSCGRFRFFEFFSKSSKSKDGWQVWCKPCIKEYDAKRYTTPKEKERLKKKNRERNKKNRNYISKILKESPCVDCGENDIIVLEFDHVRGEKLFDISFAKARGYSIKKIQEEINKCEVRCANCHRRITHKRRQRGVVSE